MQACTCASTAAQHAGHMLCPPAAHERRPARTRCFGHMSVSEAATSAGAAPAAGGAQMARSLLLSSRGRRPGDVMGYGRLRTSGATSRAARARPRRRPRSASPTRIWYDSELNNDARLALKSASSRSLLRTPRHTQSRRRKVVPDAFFGGLGLHPDDAFSDD